MRACVVNTKLSTLKALKRQSLQDTRGGSQMHVQADRLGGADCTPGVGPDAGWIGEPRHAAALVQAHRHAALRAEPKDGIPAWVFESRQAENVRRAVPDHALVAVLDGAGDLSGGE